MTPREVGVLPPERRRMLLDTAAREFARSGFERASLNRIIRACGMSKSSFYHYFTSKDALFDAVIAEVGAMLAAEFALPAPENLADGDFWRRVGDLVDHLARHSQDERFADFGKLFYLPDAPAGEGRPLNQVRAQIDGWLDRALAAGRAAGAVRDDVPASLQAQLTLAVLSAMDEWTVRHLDTLDAAQRRRLARVQFDAIRRLLATEATPGG